MEEANCAPVPQALEIAVLSILREIGEDPNREVLQQCALYARPYILQLTHLRCGTAGPGWPALMLKEGMCMGMQGLQGSAGNYVKFLLASTAGCRQLANRLTAEAPCQAGEADCAMDAEAAAEEVHLHFMSHCEHHMLPFHGVLHVAYVPGRSGQSISIETMQSLLRTYSRRLQIQERLTQQITNAVQCATGVNGLSMTPISYSSG